jgi:hypothetical protein
MKNPDALRIFFPEFLAENINHTTVPYVDKVKSLKKKPRGFPNRSERYGAKYEN